MRINGHVSDLFFNLDFDNCRIMENGKFAGFNEERLLEEATWFADSIVKIGGPIVTPVDLVQDFYARV